MYILAHLNSSSCDYAEFDRNDTFIKKMIRQKLHEHFTQLGYNVKSEIKVLEHHYSHLLFELNEHKIAVELGTKQTTVSQVEKINKEYGCAGIEVNWVVVDDTTKCVLENQTFFLKRFALINRKGKPETPAGIDGLNVKFVEL